MFQDIYLGKIHKSFSTPKATAAAGLKRCQFLMVFSALIVTFDADLPLQLVLEKNVKTTLGDWNFVASMCA